MFLIPHNNHDQQFYKSKRDFPAVISLYIVILLNGKLMIRFMLGVKRHFQQYEP